MKNWIIIFIFIIFIFLVPIRLKFTIIFENNKFNLYLFNIKLNKKKKKEKKVSKKNKPKASFLKDPLKILSNLYFNKFKPKLSIEASINYGFDDAAITGICYGILHSLSSYIFLLTNCITKIKKYEFNVNPHFNEETFNFRISSIISLNLAKLIYMGILIIKK
jgi:Protein of unknown function (DUF2953).